MPSRSPPPGERGRRIAVAEARPIAAALKLDPGHRERIDESHERCLALGLSRRIRPDLSPMGSSGFLVVRERNLRLSRHAAPVMEMLREQIADTESMVVLTDAAGTVLHATGDTDFLARASKVALAPGVNWSESAQGTNAIGTALIDETATLVHADEHFMHANHFLTCSAVPILDPRGNILGVLDVTGDHRSYHPHTMALVTMSARMIENHWLNDDHRHLLRLHFHHRPEFIGTLAGGILAVTPEGRIAGANRGALEQLGMSGAALRMHSVQSLLGIGVGALIDRFRSPFAAPLPLHGADGRHIHLVARFEGPPAWTPAAAFDAGALELRSEPAPPVKPAAPTLAQIDTGDARVAATIARVRRVLNRGLPILVTGETGTGKDWLARAIHAESARRDRPLRVIDGAAPGALGAHPDGELLISEVADLPAAEQARLLHLLNETGVAPICTTQHDLRERIAKGLFREDLFQRLNGLSLALPPLRERTDFEALVQTMLAAEGPAPTLADEVMPLLARHGWPGNLRQLAHVLRAATGLAGPGATITREHLPEEIAATPAAAEPPSTLGEVEREAILRAIDAAGGNISQASRQLRIGRNTIYRKLKGR